MLGVSLKQIWSVLNTLQLIVYTSEVKANLPAISLTVLSELRRIALFEFIPYEVVTDKLKAMLPSSSDQEEFEEASVLDEMGAMFIIGLGLLLTICITLLIALLCKKKSPLCTKLAFKLKQKLLWNSVIRYTL